jgi:surfactin synthase thioesterase subunit
MTAFAGRRDPVVTEDEVAGWADHTTGSFRLHPVPGDHFFLAECRDQVFDVLTRSLREHDSAMTQNGTEKPSPVVRAL